MARPGISKREILEYVRLEECEEASERLKQSSFVYVGSQIKGHKKVFYWSYPSVDEVCWVSLSACGTLSTVARADVPSEIAALALPHHEHPVRSTDASQGLVDRSQIASPKWVPASRAPRLFYFPMYGLDYSFSRAVATFSAKSKREDLGGGFWHLYFCLKLTSGRYAIIQAEEARPNQIAIELEVEESDGDYPLGFVYVRDLKEILSALGVQCAYPLKKCQYEWRE